MQNSGLSNALNPLISIAHEKSLFNTIDTYYRLERVPKFKDEPQHNVKER